MDGSKSQFHEYKGIGYEFFILVLSTLSLVNLIFYILPDLVPAATEIVTIVDLFISLVFIVDFLLRFFTYDSKSYYFFRNWGWADLLSALPFPLAKIFRLFRIIRIIMVMQKAGFGKIKSEISRDRAEVALFFIMIFIIIIIELASVLVVQFESVSPEALIHTGGDGIWWSFVTVATVGYGDLYPVTTSGRIVGILLMISGVSVFGTLAGFLSSKLMPSKDEVSGVEDSLETAGIEDLHNLLMECRDVQDKITEKIELLEMSLKDNGRK